MMNFLKKHKKLTIIFSIVLVILLTTIILIFTLFSLKEVSLNFKTETEMLNAETQQEIIDEVYNSGISTVLFTDKNKLIQKLEKDFPYLKIINIETTIPSGFIIHCAEREELYAVQSRGKVYYLDEEMKILKIEEENFAKTNSNAVLLNISNLELNIENAEVGQFLNFGKVDLSDPSSVLAGKANDLLLNLLTVFEENNREIALVRSSFESFKINWKFQQVEDGRVWYVCLSLVHSTGFETEIVEADKDLSKKIEIMLNVIDELALENPTDLLTHKLTIYNNANGQLVYLLID